MDPLEIIEELDKYKHIISDFDGTLVILEINWLEVLEKTNDFIKKELRFPIQLKNLWELVEVYPDMYLKHKQEFDSIIKEAEEKALAKRAWQKVNGFLWKAYEEREFSIFSNNFSSTVGEILAEEGLIPSIIVGRDHVKLPKPHPEGIKKILETFNLRKEEVVFVGDTVWDRKTAERAGIDYIPVANRLV